MGVPYSEAHLRALVATADALRIPIVADEVYDGMVFHGETFTPIAAVSTSVPVLSVGALSKKCLVRGNLPPPPPAVQWKLGLILQRFDLDYGVTGYPHLPVPEQHPWLDTLS
jgi:hypothetical protein